MKQVFIRYAPPSHEGEYVIHITSPYSEWPGEINDMQDIRYYDLKEWLGETESYQVLNRGTRLEIIGERDDDLVKEWFRRIGVEVNYLGERE